MKKNLLPLSIITVVFISAIAALITFQQPNIGIDKTEEKVSLEGTVTFIGKPCPPEEISGRTPQVPPCDGPYPNYEITVYAIDGKTIVATTVSDENGNYEISLNPGDYVIYTQNGPLEEDIKTNQLTILSGETTKLDLVVDTGIR